MKWLKNIDDSTLETGYLLFLGLLLFVIFPIIAFFQEIRTGVYYVIGIIIVLLIYATLRDP